MIQITSIKRLIYASNNVGPGLQKSAERQVSVMKERVSSGTGVGGDLFAPYKDPSRYHSPHPLAHAAKLFDNVDYKLGYGVGGALEASATITGQAAKIALYQNLHRKFIGYSMTDKKQLFENIANSMREAAAKWR